MTPLTLYGISEARPGARWQQLFDAVWPAYRRWYLSEGAAARPDLATAAGRLRRHLPELVPTWERLVELAGDDPVAAPMLTLWDPPTFAPGCSQVAVAAPRPTLVRNYDYGPELFEGVVWSSRLDQRRVVGTGDCLWGLLDGMNDAGLVVSLTFGGRSGSAPGFAAPLVVRYLLEVAVSTAEACELLEHVPVSMSYNLTLLDATGATTTAFVAPGERPAYFDGPATNHRARTPERPEHARRFRSVERQDALDAALADDVSLPELTARFLKPPLWSGEYDRAFGTLYTAVYRPLDGEVDYVWRDARWTRSFASGEEIFVVDPTSQPAVGSPATPSGPVEPATPAGPGQGGDARALAEQARSAVRELSLLSDPAAFAELLALYETLGLALGTSARTLAEQGSWSTVGDVAGVSRQAAWYRWRG